MRAQDKKKIVSTIENLLGKGESKHIKEVASSLVKIPKKDRNAILDSLEKDLYKKENVGKILVTTSGELAESEKKKIEHAIQHKYEFDHVVLEEKIDKSVIGGVKVRVEDELYDGTIKTKIKKLSNILIN